MQRRVMSLRGALRDAMLRYARCDSMQLRATRYADAAAESKMAIER